jgi:hypothetical protein
VKRRTDATTDDPSSIGDPPAPPGLEKLVAATRPEPPEDQPSVRVGESNEPPRVRLRTRGLM